jgi:hypothetical protein
MADNSGGGGNTFLALIVGGLLVVVVIFFVFGGFPRPNTGPTIKVEIPKVGQVHVAEPILPA